jgi:hypothetical protein
MTSTTPNKGKALDAAVKEAGRTDLTPDQAADLYSRIAVMSYWLAQEVAEAYRAFSNAEGDRKAHMARHVITMQATGASNAKAQATVEGSDEYQGLRMAEVEAECEYIRWKQTAQGVQNVLSSLQMRIAMLRDERRWTATTPAVR